MLCKGMWGLYNWGPNIIEINLAPTYLFNPLKQFCVLFIAQTMIGCCLGEQLVLVRTPAAGVWTGLFIY